MQSHVSYLVQIQQRGDWFLGTLVAVLFMASMLLAPMHHTWPEVLSIGLPTLAVVGLLVRTQPGTLLTRCVIGSALMVLLALQIHQTHAVEAHFGMIAALAFLIYYRDWIPIVVAASVVAVHHIAFFLLQHAGAPVWLLPEDAGFSRVLVHAAYVVVETLTLGLMARQLRAEIDAVGSDPRDLARVAHALAQGDVEVAVTVDSTRTPSLAAAMLLMRDELHSAVRGTGEVLEAVSSGDLSKRIAIETEGEFTRLKDYVNRTAEALTAVAGRQHAVLQRATAGDFSARCDTGRISGYQLEMAHGLNQLMQSLDTFFGEFAEVQVALAQGDLTKSILQAYPGQLDRLRLATNHTLDHLANTVARIQRSADEIGAASTEISRGNSDLARRTDQQGDAVQSTARALEELANVVRNNAQHTASANELAAAAHDTAARGGGLVSSLVTTMQDLNASSGKVASIIGVIEDIAFQTNLLALNAAVEAARAGESGAGFAVVAAEVRSLAGRSAAAAKEISSLIRDNIARIDSSAALVGQSGQAMQEIVAAINKVAHVVDEVAAAIRQQSTEIDAINKAITLIKESTQQNAALVEKEAAATESMERQTQALREVVKCFKVRATTASTAPANQSSTRQKLRALEGGKLRHS